ncbi:snapalysin [Streptomyces sp. SID3343]|uniref:snapalysin n=1 Tax=Streptomyces sp. SID3343 TaxID=2690260 RepID=UPI001369BF6D|nr:snapalysin [Streptomyces sp. SID3343]MYV99295.1 snapalysin [Streptomyces sp. SID3343]
MSGPRPPRTRKILLSTALGLGLAAGLVAAPAASAAPPPPVAAPLVAAAYSGHESEAQNKAFLDAVMKSVASKRAAAPNSLAAVTVYYSTANAPSFRTQIAQSAQIWNSSVTNVRLQEGGNADFQYYEGNSAQGSYASTDGHGNGYIFLDYRQNQQYNSTRVTAHETGHVLGLPDHYSGPCSELMSGGGPGTSCTNPNPNATERARVNNLWRNGLVAFTTAS